MFRGHYRRTPRHLYAYNRQMGWMNDWNQYVPNNPQMFTPFNPQSSGGWGMFNQMSFPFQSQGQQYTDSPFAGPYSMQSGQVDQQNWGANSFGFMNPYPIQTQQQFQQQQKQFSTFLNQFKGQDGSLDMKKMMDTAGQMMNTVNQLNGLIKGITSTFKA
ncbi:MULTISPECIES: YppG family protein [Sutcliffiella]|uniref:YppG-like protein n=1 Tax=Sutcliffiella cohnii TaxID=33932 RepID=A0A223KQB5_9BACI|nr:MULTISPECIES: YppG family protein [Sutcliffiella]AST91606.1 hypothetical protein BC6307_10085 [Sutcliffiella cohnii]MED4014814.1 YppG family protein [Sutcliffiella cohnii]WBL17437.1 YppG family protein [Sutcliffiella sp. NC1]